MPTPVHIVAGFLGAGKTTAVRAWMAAHEGRERAAVIVNDFGEAGIDAALLGGDVAVTNIPGGCVCCTAPAGLARAIATVLEDIRPDRVFIEPSGLARPQDVVDMLTRGGLRDRVALQPTLVLVDPGTLAAAPPLLDTQLEAADVLVANRCDLAAPADLEAFRTRAAALWPGPLRVIETSHGVLPDDALGWPAAPTLRLAAVATERPPSTEGYRARSWTWGPDVHFAWDPLRALLETAPGIVRFKGLFTGDIGWFRVDIAGGKLHLAATAWRRDNRADLIVGASGDLDAFAAALDACRVTTDAATDQPVVALVDLDGFELRLAREALAGLDTQVADVSVLVPGRVGAGVMLREVLALVPASTGARFVVIANDGMTTAPADVAGVGDAVLVHTLDAGPLPDKQGGPFRLLVPPGEGRSNCANVKGVARIRLLPAG
jgi:G3E family GTPase